MSAVYKRKRISNLDDLDKEEARLRKKTKSLEKEWVELLNPQQLAIDFALGFLTNKITGKASPLKLVSSLFSSKSNVEKATTNLGDAKKRKKSKVMKIVKGIGIAFIAIQAMKLIIAAVNKNKTKTKA